MEKTIPLSPIKAYLLLVKPGIMMGNAITMAGGFALASRSYFDGWLFFATLIGLISIIGSSCIVNNVIDERADQQMERTKKRALAFASLPRSQIFLAALLLGAVGVLSLSLFANFLTLCIALFGYFIYVGLYSFSKYHSAQGTLIGSLAGAVSPVIGYCAVSHDLDLGAWILFAMLVLWQMPHFYAIAIYRSQDYASASIPVFPAQKGIKKTKIHMLLYTIAFAIVSLLLFVFGYTGYGYLAVAVSLGMIWIGLSLKGFRSVNDDQWAKKMFRFSLIVVMALSMAMMI